MSAHDEGTEGSSSTSRPSTFVGRSQHLYFIGNHSFLHGELLSATTQRNALVMANTIREGFAARPSIEGARNIHVLGTWRGRLVVSKWWWLHPATPKGMEQLMLSLSWTPRIRNNLWLLLPPWIGRWRISRFLRLWVCLQVCHILKTPLLPEKLKLRMDRELCPSNTPLVSAKKVNQLLFNKRGVPMAAIWGHDLQLQSVQKIMTKAMLPLRHLLCLALQKPRMPVWTASACSPVRTCRWTRCAERGLRLLYQPVTRAWSMYLIRPQSSCLGIWTSG